MSNLDLGSRQEVARILYRARCFRWSSGQRWPAGRRRTLRSSTTALSSSVQIARRAVAKCTRGHSLRVEAWTCTHLPRPLGRLRWGRFADPVDALLNRGGLASPLAIHRDVRPTTSGLLQPFPSCRPSASLTGQPGRDVLSRATTDWRLTRATEGEAAIPPARRALHPERGYDGVGFPAPRSVLRPHPARSLPGERLPLARVRHPPRQVPLRHRRRHVVAGQGHPLGEPRAALGGARPARTIQKFDPYINVDAAR